MSIEIGVDIQYPLKIAFYNTMIYIQIKSENTKLISCSKNNIFTEPPTTNIF